MYVPSKVVFHVEVNLKQDIFIKGSKAKDKDVSDAQREVQCISQNCSHNKKFILLSSLHSFPDTLQAHTLKIQWNLGPRAVAQL